MSVIEVSTPGKVLVCGGYVVLQGAHSLVLSTTSRFHTILKHQRILSSSADQSNIQKEYIFVITVHSNQFESSWKYKCAVKFDCDHLPSNVSSIKFEFNQLVEDGVSSSKNIFVEMSLKYGFATMAAKIVQGQTICLPFGAYTLHFDIFADNDFYSYSKFLREQSIIPTRKNLSTVPVNTPLGSAKAKTGLGSSAALVSSLTASLLCFGFQWSDSSKTHDIQNLLLVHNVAQAAHCHAQGKVGSGFDVASAIMGSHSYIKFHASYLDQIIYFQSTSDQSTLTPWLEAIKTNISLNWFSSPASPQTPFSKPSSLHLPHGISMVLGECGKDMNTPTSVRQVLNWASENPDLWTSIFNQLNINNQNIVSSLLKLISYASSPDHVASYDRTLKMFAQMENSSWNSSIFETDTEKSVALLFIDIRDRFKQQRLLMKKLGEDAKTPIEPFEISTILDKTETQIAGVLATGAPGAGGYDAVFALILEREGGLEQVEHCWLSNEELPLSCLTTEEGGIGFRLDKYEQIE